MKKGSILLALAVTLGMLMLMAPQARAGAAYVCTVDQVGQAGATDTKFLLSDTAGTPAFTEKWCVPQFPDRSKEMLAIALTAMSSGMNVWVYISNQASPGTFNISQMQLTNQ